MVTRIWNGGSGDWTNPARWTTAVTGATGAPIPGDTAVVSSGDATIVGSEGLNGSTYDGVALILGDAATDQARLDLSGAFLGSFFSIQAAGSATIAAQGACGIACSVTDTVAGSTLTLDGGTSGPNGLILADGDSINVGERTAIGASGSLTLQGLITDENASGVNVYGDAENDGTVKVIAGSGFNIYAALTGTGTIDVSNAASARFYGSVSAKQTITFGDVAGRLLIADPSDFEGAITGFAPGNQIDFSTINAVAATYDAATRTLALIDDSGTTVAELQHVQAAPGALTVTADSGGTGTTVGYANALPRGRYEIADGDRAMQSDVVRATMTVPGTVAPITGAGVKVGIISTSFDLDGLANQDVAAGYLPANPDGTSAVDVLQEGAAGNDDEGRAMAELVHQVAPGAQLYFAAGGDSQSEYESAVTALTQAGCNVIADDITYFATPFYQVTGGLDDVVSTAVASGVNFFTSAGNYGQSFLEAPFAPQSETIAGLTGPQKAEVFSNGTPYERITIPGGVSTRIDLQYTAPYEGVDGTGAPYALTLKVYDANGNPLPNGTGRLVTADGVLTTDQYYPLPTTSAATDYQIAVYLNGNQVSPADFKLILTASGGGTGPGGTIDDPEAGRGSGDARGQQLIPGVNTVGASDSANSAAFGGAPSYNEYFSDQGPGTLLYDGAGHTLPSPQSAGKVDFDAPDGIDTPVPGFAPFFGTSAATPNGAGVAALMLQANPNLTTAQVTSLLEQSAVNQGLPAAQQGAGLIQADRAVTLAIDALPPTIAGTVPVQMTRNEDPIRPFSTVLLADPDAAATDTLTITLTGAGGVLADGIGFSGLGRSGDAYVLTGTAAAIASEVRALVFTPSAGQPNTSSTTTFVLTDQAGAGRTASGGPVSVIDVDPAVAPTITGTHATADAGEAQVAPFGTLGAGPGATVTDPNAGATETLVIQLSGGGGALAEGASYAGPRTLAQTDPGPLGAYTLTGPAAAVSAELDALTFTPANGTAGASTTLALTDESSAGTAATDGGTVVSGTLAPPPGLTPSPAPVPPPGSTPSPTPMPPPSPDVASISSTVTYRRGVFTLTGTASSAVGVRSVEITAQVDGGATDLGSATVDAQGNFSFADVIGPAVQNSIIATETDDAGGTVSAGAPFSLTGGLGPLGGVGRQDTYTDDGATAAVTALFRPSGTRFLDIEAPEQVVPLQPYNIVAGHHEAGTSFVFSPGDGLDVIAGFKTGGADHDTIVLPAADFRNFAAVLRDAGDVGGSSVITDPSTGDAIRLAGVTTAELREHPKDFVFST